MAKYETKFISQNKAPNNNNYIYVYKGSELIGKVKTGVIKMPALGEKQYSFGALADVHVFHNTGHEDFKRALAYLNNEENVAFTCIAGDLTSTGTASELQTFGEYVKTYSPNTPVYEITGNHDVQTMRADFEFLKPYTGHNLYYSFTQGNDVFIMFGMSGWASYTGDIFSIEGLQWLYETLEANRNKRCFVFEHCPRFDGSGKPYELEPTGNLLSYPQGQIFQRLMEHYKNVIWLHGHTHMSFECQKDCSYSNYDKMFGCHSVHVPSLAMGRVINDEGTGYVNVYTESTGYVVDVYEKHIVLRGRDFANEKFVPIATYCLDTTIQNIEANTFTDSTGTIKTQ